MALLTNDACGSPIPIQVCLPWMYFDGKLFHSKLIKATQARNLIELCEGRVEMAYQIERIRDIIMTGHVNHNRPPGSVHQQPWRAAPNKAKPQYPQQKKKNKVRDVL